MKNFIKQGITVTLTAPYQRNSGEAALFAGNLLGVATADTALSALGEFMVEGVFALAKTSAQAWVEGQKIYWDNTNKRCDSDGTLGPCIGIATDIAANPSATGNVRLNGVSTPRLANVKEQTSAPASYATAAPQTYTAADMLSGTIVRDPNGAARTDVLPTAALLVAAVPSAKIGDTIETLITNGADAAEVLTLSAGAGGTFDANQTAASRVIGQNASKLVKCRLTNVTLTTEAYVIYA